jgi:pyruvate/2-oxoglutarate/acetoin dehydrogenase E1 component
MCLKDTSNHFLFLTRIGNDIIFGRSTEGTREKLITIKMVSPSDFKKIYESIKGEFESIFVENTKHTFGIGWSLVPFIGDNIMIRVESSNQYDTEWIYDVVHHKSSTK